MRLSTEYFQEKTHNLYRLFLSLFLGLLVLLSFTAQTAYAAAAPVTAEIPVTCTGKNTSEAFTCLLTLEESEFQTAAQTSLTLTNGQTGAFQIDYTYPGTYHCTIRQAAGNDTGTTYDQSVYTVDVYVTENSEGVLSAEPVVYLKGSSDKKTSVSFVNEKKNTAVPSEGKSTGSVNTGDTTDIFGWSVLLGSTCLCLLATAVICKKRERR